MIKKITVFTATFNRKKTLKRLYVSLIAQNNKNFEWVIVDDGSTDDTEKYIEKIAKDNLITIRYYKQSNKGKHVAYNKGVKLANGDLFFCVDSDDYLIPEAIQLIYDNADNLEPFDCGFIAGKVDEKGKNLSIGLDLNMPHRGLYGLMKLGVVGEFSLVLKTEVLRKYNFPEVHTEKFMGECVLYDKLELNGFSFCPIPDNITICEYQADGLTNKFFKIMINNPIGYKIYYIQRIELATNFKERIGYCIRYAAFCFLSKDKKYKYVGKHKLLVLLLTLPGIFAFVYYKLKGCN